MSLPLTERDLRSIGDVTITARLGEGASAVVYIGATKDKNPVAVKVLHPHLASSSAVRDALRREADALERVSGPRVARVLDIDVDGDRPYLVMEYIPGRTLSEFVSTQALAGALLITVLDGVAEALESIHAVGVVHRDLKPSNVIVGPDGVFVLDFGISLIEDIASGTRTGAFQGTPAWLSPEQATGAPVGPASDVFNLGMLIVFATTGGNPFGQGRSDAMLYRVVNEEPDLDAVPPHLQDLARRCLSKSAASRPTTSQVRAELAHFGGSGGSPDPNATMQASGTVLASSTLLARSAKDDADARAHAAPARRKSRMGLLIGAGAAVVVALVVLGVVIANLLAPFGGSIVVADSDSSLANPFVTKPRVTIAVEDGEGGEVTLEGSGEQPAGAWRLNSTITVDYQPGFKEDETFSKTWTAQELGLNVFAVGQPLTVIVDATDDAVTVRLEAPGLFGRQAAAGGVLARVNEKEYIAEQTALLTQCVSSVTEGWTAELAPIVNSSAAYNNALNNNGFTTGAYADWNVWGARASSMADELFVTLAAAVAAAPSEKSSAVAPFTEQLSAAADEPIDALSDAIEGWDLLSGALYLQYSYGGEGAIADVFPRENALITTASDTLATGASELAAAIPAEAEASCRATYPDAQ